MFNDYQDEVRYLALEGSTLTLLGLIKYDSQTDSVEMTELVSVIAGGMDEVGRVLNEKIKTASKRFYTCVLIGSLLLIIGGVSVYRW